MYSTVKVHPIRDPNLGLEETISMTKTIVINHYERSLVPKRSQELYRKIWNDGLESRIRNNVRESAMTLTCHSCKKPGHKMKDCKQLTKKSNKSSNVESGTRKWCSYHHSNDHLNEDCHQQQSESENVNRKEIWYTYQDSGCRSDGECYYKRKGKRSSPAGSKSANYETFVADSNETGCDKCSCNRKVENKCTEIDDQPNNTTPGIGLSFAMCHPPLSEEAIGFQLKVDSGSSKHFTSPELIRGAESRTLDYTRI